MEKLPIFDRPSLRNFRSQRFWQIILPIVLVSLLFGVIGGLTIFTEGEISRLWADVSIIWLVLPLLGFALVILLILIGMIYLLHKLTKGTPRITRKVQNVFIRIEQETCRISNTAVKPVLWIHQFQSGFKGLMRKIIPGTKKGKNYGKQ